MSTISVIIPTFNREKLILRALDSVLTQSFRDIEVWIIDDGGNDDTEKVVRARADESPDIPVHFIHTPNRGVAAARNTGIHRSSGSWIALLDSDDEWLPGKLEKQMAFSLENPGISLIHTEEIWIRKGIRVNPPKAYRRFGGDVFEKSLPVCMIGPSTAMFRRDLFEKTGGFDENYPVCEDYDFWLRTTKRYETGLIPEALTIKYGGHADQLSTTHVAMDYWRVRSMCGIMKTGELSPQRQEAVLRELSRRGSTLLKGYIKHGREEKFREVLTMIRSVDHYFEFKWPIPPNFL